VQIERDGGIFICLPPPQCYTARLSLRIARLALGDLFDTRMLLTKATKESPERKKRPILSIYPIPVHQSD
jgi:hypothetical protein